MDPEGGSQPIYNENQSAAIVANGEVYNHLTLRRQLEGGSFEKLSKFVARVDHLAS
jgi:asparagine synthase (glutamine-hydrolysing)